MVQGGMSCIKYLMFVFNFIFVICGVALIALGAVVQKEDFTIFLDSKFLTAPTILIVVGVIIFILAFLGCCGAVRENHCMVLTFGLLLFLIVVVQIAGGISAYVYRNELEGILKEGMNSTIQQNKEDAKKIWDEMQFTAQCCGVDSVTDYPAGRIPKSCCSAEAETCTAANAHKQGCFDRLLHEVKGRIIRVGGVAVGVAVVELIGVMFSLCLASAIKKKR